MARVSYRGSFFPLFFCPEILCDAAGRFLWWRRRRQKRRRKRKEWEEEDAADLPDGARLLFHLGRGAAGRGCAGLREWPVIEAASCIECLIVVITRPLLRRACACGALRGVRRGPTPRRGLLKVIPVSPLYKVFL